MEHVPNGSTVTVTCKGKACPKRLVKRNASGTVSLAAYVKRAFRAGNVLTVKVTKPGTCGVAATLTIRKAKAPLLKQT